MIEENQRERITDMNDSDSTLVPVKRHGRLPRLTSWIVPLFFGLLAALLLSGAGALTVFFLLRFTPTAPAPASAAPAILTVCDPDTAAGNLLNPDAEVRGVYIATVTNINFPSKKGLSVPDLKAELDDIVKTCKAAGLNAIYFQVRPSADALYKSEIFPVSEYLTGKQGWTLPSDKSGEFDPLAYLLKIAHDENILVHAWVNPLRVTVGSASAPKTDPSALAKDHPARLHPEYTVAYADGRLYFNPGLPEVRDLIADGLSELVENYDVDGVIFDDYFYPYPTTVKVNGKNVTAEFDDAEAYKLYGGKASLADWRRENINQMMKACYEAVKAADNECLFGAAPFGIWQNDDGKNGGSATGGMEAYDAIYCDPIAWAEGGYVDYISPQIYWRFSTEVAPYDVLVRWWNAALDGTGVDLIVSHGIYNYDTWENPELEITHQIEYARSELCYRGSIHYGWAALKKNSHGLLDEITAAYQKEIIYADIAPSGQALYFSLPYSGSIIDGEGSFLLGTSDPGSPLYLDGQKVSRTKSGYFSVYLDLKKGRNDFTFTHKGTDSSYVLHRGTSGITSGAAQTPAAKKYEQMEAYEITAVTPATGWAGSGTKLSVSVTAPSGSTVTAELDGRKITLQPTIRPPAQGTYMKEVYTGTLPLPAAEAGKIKTLGPVVFRAKRGSLSAEAESGEIRLLGSGAVIPIEVKGDDTELKIQPTSWYYDDYTPQSAGMRDNAVSLSGGMYKLRCGGYIAEDAVRELEAPIGTATLSGAGISVTDEATFIRIGTDIPVPFNGYIENGEFIITLYNLDVASAPGIDYVKNPMFTAVRGEKSTKAGAYKYFFKLTAIENFYGFRHYYEDGAIVIRLDNPTALPDSDTPLEGKTIILDAGHGGKNPGALGPLGALEGARNESDLNLEITLAAAEKLTALGARVILTRDAQCEIDVPIADRMQTLIDVDPDLCISIHQNSMPYTADVTRIRGLVGLYFADSGYMLTDVLGDTMAAALGKLSRSPTHQRLAMVRNPKFPATLIEVCFITNVEEYERMLQPTAIDEIADSLAQGVLNYYAAQEKYLLNQTNS